MAAQSSFWAYFNNILRLPWLADKGALQGLAQGLARALDASRDDSLYLRQQFFPTLCEKAMLAEHGLSRGIIRHAKESVEQYRARVAHAYAWHLLGGKTLGLPEILKFYGFDIETIENRRQYLPSRWAEFEVCLKTVNSPEALDILLKDLPDLFWLINEYKPARSVVARMYNKEYDARFIIWSRRSTWSRFYWSFDSGVPYEQHGTLISLGYKHASISQPLAIAVFPSHRACRGLFLPYVRAWLWGWSRWSEKYPPASGFVHGQLGSYGVARAEKAWFFRRRSVAREQLVWSGASPAAGRWSDVNCRWSKGSFIVVDKPPRWGSFFWGARCGRRELTTLERWIARHGIVLPAPQAAGIAPAGGHNACRQCSLYPNNIWRGGWDKRRWNPTPPVPHNSTQAIQGE